MGVRRRTWLRWGAVVVVAALVCGGAWWIWGRPTAAAEPAATTRTVEASLTTMEKTVTGTGTLTPAVNEGVSFAVPGTVLSVDVEVGDTVTEGQQLATVDTLQLNADMLSAKAALAQAQARLSDAQDDDDGSAAASAQMDAASAQVDVASKAYGVAQADLADATLVSPVAGVVSSVTLEVGDVVGSSNASAGGSGSSASGAGSGSGSSSTSSAQFVVVGPDDWRVDTTVDEADVARVEVGDQVEMTSDNLTDTLYGVVSAIGLVSTSTSGVASFPVTVDVTDPGEALHDGVGVDVSIIYERRTDVLTVPALAVTRGEDGGSTVTTVADDGTQQQVTVETGETSGSLVEITSGLAEGDQVLVQVVTRTGSQGGQQGQNGGDGFPGGQFPGGEFPSGEFPGGQFPGGGQGGGQRNG